MICIRENIFETNSSSTHSVCVNFKKLKNNNNYLLDRLTIDSHNRCVITAIDQMEDFYDSDYKVIGECSKLNYIFTWMYIRDNGPVMNGSSIFTSDSISWPEGGIETGNYEEEYRNLLSVIQKKYPEVEGFCFLNPKNAEFDHQTSPWEEDSIINLYDSDEIYNYLFNDHLYIQIGHD